MPKKEESKDENVPNQSKDKNKNGESKIIWDTEEKWLIEKDLFIFLIQFFIFKFKSILNMFYSIILNFNLKKIRRFYINIINSKKQKNKDAVL